MSHSALFTRFGARQRKLGVAVLLAAFMSVSSAVAQQAAPTQSYDVELLIFRNLAGRETPESWVSKRPTIRSSRWKSRPTIRPNRPRRRPTLRRRWPSSPPCRRPR